MANFNILVVEGNDPKNNEFFVKAAKAGGLGLLGLYDAFFQRLDLQG